MSASGHQAERWVGRRAASSTTKYHSRDVTQRRSGSPAKGKCWGRIRRRCRLPTDGKNPRPKPQFSLGIEWLAPTTALAARASMACRSIRFQRPPNSARDRLTKLCPQFAFLGAASLECVTEHWDRVPAEGAHQFAAAKPC